MKRFLVYIPAGSHPQEYVLPWFDAGFSVIGAGEKAAGEAAFRPDVVFWPESEGSSEKVWQIAGTLCPALVVVLLTGRTVPEMPADLGDVYNRQVLGGKGVNFWVASRLEGQLDPPDWDAYRSGDALTVYDQIKALAGSVYRLLLEELFRETREWCGHTFSVLGPA